MSPNPVINVLAMSGQVNSMIRLLQQKQRLKIAFGLADKKNKGIILKSVTPNCLGNARDTIGTGKTLFEQVK